jgi:hypothetical protein
MQIQDAAVHTEARQFVATSVQRACSSVFACRCGSRHLVPLLWLAGTMPAAAVLIDRTINIQPIDVCNTDGTGCADGGGLIASSFSATEAIWAQAGLNITFLPVEDYDNSAYTTTSVSVDAATDQGRQLMRLPGHDQSSDPQTLNMYFVSNLLEPTGAETVNGFSFVGGNGMIIGPNPRLDTIAHEIGHNLGLDHATFGAGPSVPANLMTDGNYRTIPTSVSQIMSGVTDNLTAAQITQARSPLFSVRNLVEIATVEQDASPVCCQQQGGKYTFLDVSSPTGFPNGENTAPPAPPSSIPSETLSDIKIRFLPGTNVTPYIDPNPQPYTNGQQFPANVPDVAIVDQTNFVLDPSFTNDLAHGGFPLSNAPATAYFVAPVVSTLSDGTLQWEIVLSDSSRIIAEQVGGCPPPYGSGCTALPGNASLPTYSAYGEIALLFLDPTGGPGPIPFSMLFTYADGFTSQAFYDATTGTISTDALSSIDSWLPGSFPAADPSVVVPVTDQVSVDPFVLNVPEPPTALLLATATVAAWGMRGRRATR